VEELLKAVSDAPTAIARPAARRTVAGTQPKVKAPESLEAPVALFKGLSRAYAGKLERLGIQTARDVLYHFPHRYNDFSSVRTISDLMIGEEQSIIAEVWTAAPTSVGRRKATEAVIRDDTGTLRVIWWGQPFLARNLRSAGKLALSGKVTAFRGRVQMENPEWEPVDSDSLNTRRLVPVYPATEGLSHRQIRALIAEHLEEMLRQLRDPGPSRSWKAFTA